MFPESSFTACVHDVAINNTDMCLASFWVTPQRLLMTEFTVAISFDTFNLVVFVDEDKSTSFGEMLLLP